MSSKDKYSTHAAWDSVLVTLTLQDSHEPSFRLCAVLQAVVQRSHYFGRVKMLLNRVLGFGLCQSWLTTLALAQGTPVGPSCVYVYARHATRPKEKKLIKLAERPLVPLATLISTF